MVSISCVKEVPSLQPFKCQSISTAIGANGSIISGKVKRIHRLIRDPKARKVLYLEEECEKKNIVYSAVLLNKWAYEVEKADVRIGDELAFLNPQIFKHCAIQHIKEDIFEKQLVFGSPDYTKRSIWICRKKRKSKAAVKKNAGNGSKETCRVIDVLKSVRHLFSDKEWEEEFGDSFESPGSVEPTTESTAGIDDNQVNLEESQSQSIPIDRHSKLRKSFETTNDRVPSESAEKATSVSENCESEDSIACQPSRTPATSQLQSIPIDRHSKLPKSFETNNERVLSESAEEATPVTENCESGDSVACQPLPVSQSQSILIDSHSHSQSQSILIDSNSQLPLSFETNDVGARSESAEKATPVTENFETEDSVACQPPSVSQSQSILIDSHSQLPLSFETNDVGARSESAEKATPVTDNFETEDSVACQPPSVSQLQSILIDSHSQLPKSFETIDVRVPPESTEESTPITENRETEDSVACQPTFVETECTPQSMLQGNQVSFGFNAEDAESTAIEKLTADSGKYVPKNSLGRHCQFQPSEVKLKEARVVLEDCVAKDKFLCQFELTNCRYKSLRSKSNRVETSLDEDLKAAEIKKSESERFQRFKARKRKAADASRQNDCINFSQTKNIQRNVSQCVPVQTEAKRPKIDKNSSYIKLARVEEHTTVDLFAVVLKDFKTSVKKDDCTLYSIIKVTDDSIYPKEFDVKIFHHPLYPPVYEEGDIVKFHKLNIFISTDKTLYGRTFFGWNIISFDPNALTNGVNKPRVDHNKRFLSDDDLKHISELSTWWKNTRQREAELMDEIFGDDSENKKSVDGSKDDKKVKKLDNNFLLKIPKDGTTSVKNSVNIRKLNVLLVKNPMIEKMVRTGTSFRRLRKRLVRCDLSSQSETPSIFLRKVKNCGGEQKKSNFRDGEALYASEEYETEEDELWEKSLAELVGSDPGDGLAHNRKHFAKLEGCRAVNKLSCVLPEKPLNSPLVPEKSYLESSETETVKNEAVDKASSKDQESNNPAKKSKHVSAENSVPKTSSSSPLSKRVRIAECPDMDTPLKSATVELEISDESKLRVSGIAHSSIAGVPKDHSLSQRALFSVHSSKSPKTLCSKEIDQRALHPNCAISFASKQKTFAFETNQSDSSAQDPVSSSKFEVQTSCLKAAPSITPENIWRKICHRSKTNKSDPTVRNPKALGPISSGKFEEKTTHFTTPSANVPETPFSGSPHPSSAKESDPMVPDLVFSTILDEKTGHFTAPSANVSKDPHPEFSPCLDEEIGHFTAPANISKVPHPGSSPCLEQPSIQSIYFDLLKDPRSLSVITLKKRAVPGAVNPNHFCKEPFQTKTEPSYGGDIVSCEGDTCPESVKQEQSDDAAQDSILDFNTQISLIQDSQFESFIRTEDPMKDYLVLGIRPFCKDLKPVITAGFCGRGCKKHFLFPRPPSSIWDGATMCPDCNSKGHVGELQIEFYMMLDLINVDTQECVNALFVSPIVDDFLECSIKDFVKDRQKQRKAMKKLSDLLCSEASLVDAGVCTKKKIKLLLKQVEITSGNGTLYLVSAFQTDVP